MQRGLMTYLYDDFIVTLSKKIEAKLNDIQAVYNFDCGPEFELAICELLREFLPDKYGICRGFVVDKNGQREGDDIIVFDQHNFPTLRALKGNFSKKEKIPIEAVYAYFEAKHSLNIDNNDNSNLTKALEQLSKVKKLILSREKYGLSQNDTYHSYASPKVIPDHIYPARNPVFTMIVSNGVYVGRERTNSDELISEKLIAYFSDKAMDEYYPEGIVVGSNHYLSTAISIPTGVSCTNFVLPNAENNYFLINKPSLALAVGLVHLYSAIDFIRLGRMPWEEIFNDAKK